MGRDIHIRCRDCASVYALLRIQDTIHTPITYCMFCGSASLAMGEDDADYWMTLAIDLGLPRVEQSREAVKAMFESWSPTEGDNIRFVDFARGMITHAQAS